MARPTGCRSGVRLVELWEGGVCTTTLWGAPDDDGGQGR